MQRLFEYQSFVDRFIVADWYKVERMDMGCQPWEIPIPGEYYEEYQLGFRAIPDGPLHQYIARQVGVDVPLAIRYEHPVLPVIDWNGAPAVELINKLGHEPRMHLPYVCLAPRSPSSYDQLFYDLSIALRQINVDVVQIGGEGQYVGVGRDATGLDMLDTLSILSRADGFVGLMSSQLVLANGFDIPRIAPHDGRSWDMRHVVAYHLNHYPVNPTATDIIELLRRTNDNTWSTDT